MNFSKKELESFITELESRGYKKYRGHYKSEDFGYWKSNEVYQIAYLIYDYSKYPQHTEKQIGIQMECLMKEDKSKIDRIDFMCCDDTKFNDIDWWETMCEKLSKTVLDSN